MLGALPGGKQGTIATLKHMKEFVRQAVRAPDQRIRLKAAEIFQSNRVPPRKWNLELSTLHAFVRDQIRYLKDPVGLELVQAPARTLDIGQGDCDDKSTLLASLLMATGHPARFTAVAFNARPYSHVLVEARSGLKWIPMETIIDKPMGWFPSGVTDKYSLNL